MNQTPLHPSGIAPGAFSTTLRSYRPAQKRIGASCLVNAPLKKSTQATEIGFLKGFEPLEVAYA
jgi:hypothetical protein